MECLGFHMFWWRCHNCDGVMCHRFPMSTMVAARCAANASGRGSAWNDYSQIVYSSLNMQQELPNMQAPSLYRIVGNFWGRKLSRLCGYSRKFSPQNLAVWCLLAAPASNLQKFFPHSENVTNPFVSSATSSQVGYNPRTRFVYYSHKSLATCAMNSYPTWLVLYCYYRERICTCASVYTQLCIKSVL